MIDDESDDNHSYTSSNNGDGPMSVLTGQYHHGWVVGEINNSGQKQEQTS